MSLFGIVVLLLLQDIVHGTHNARHGGVFFSSRDDTFHVEGVWPRQRTLKVYVTDAADRPLDAARLRAIRGRVLIGNADFPLVLREQDRLFEARIPVLRPPAELIVELRTPGQAEPDGFQFIFGGFSDERALSFSTDPTVIPRTLPGVLDALKRDVRDAERLMADNQSAYVFAPALRARDHALALERHFTTLPPGRRPRAEAAIRAAVRAAWLLHTAGDDGTPPQAQAATAELRAAVDDVVAAMGPKR